ncbi:MAG: hypothetical protein IIZ17_01765 [Eubacteriaceae bacterium]|nr:hypothetical protein [Eubacteriaceae bacterium]
MHHSIIISGKDTFDEWGMVATSRPSIAQPKVKTRYTDLPSSHGQLDYTNYLLSEVPFGQREGSWEFLLRPGKKWSEVYSSLANFLHGERHTVVLEDDPKYQYVGRLQVDDWTSDPSRSLITISYNLDPFKYSVDDSADCDWLWNDLFADYIRYGRFTVKGTKHRTFINNGKRAAVPTFTCTAPLAVEFGGETFSLVKGRNHNLNLIFQPGDNLMVFKGYADVLVSYKEASL